MCVRGKAIIKPGRLEPHPIQSRGGQRSGNSEFMGGNLDRDERSGAGEAKTQKRTIFGENF